MLTARTNRSLWVRIRANWVLYLFLLPMIVYFLIFNYLPMFGIVMAFEDFNVAKGFMASPWAGLRHFKRFVTSFWFPALMRNTLTLSILNLVIGFPSPVILALLLNEVTSARLKKTIQTTIYAPYFISNVIMCGLVVMFLSPSTGFLGQLFAAFGQTSSLMQNLSAFKWIYVLSDVWKNTGWNSVIYFAALSNVNPDLLEAAKIDGANKVQRVIHINFPTLVPTIVILLIMNVGGLMSSNTEKVLLLQNEMNTQASEVIGTYVYKAGLVNAQYSYSAAIGLFNSVVNLLLLIAVNTVSRRVGETSLW